MTPATLDLTVTRGVTFGPVVITCKDANGAAVNLAGYTPFAEVRKKAGEAVVRDLALAITNAAAGEVTIPEISDEATMKMTKGSYRWDFVLQNAGGKRFGPHAAGTFIVQNIITQAVAS